LSHDTVTDELWTHAATLAAAIKDTPKLGSFRRAFDADAQGDDLHQRVSMLTAQYSPLRSYPMLLGMRLNSLPATAQLLETEQDTAWLNDAVEAGGAFQVIIEFLRSRLPGYPGLRVPHIRPGSPHIFNDPFSIQGFPWDPELRRLGLQLQNPPDMAPLGAGTDCRALLTAVVTGLEARPAWTRFAAAYASLSESDVRVLSELSRVFAARVTEEALTEAAGDYVLDRFQYRVATLLEVVTSAEGAVAEYLAAFEAVDEVVTVVAALLETLLTSDGLLTIEPYRMDLGAGTDLRPAELAVRGDDPFHNPGTLLFVQGPNQVLSGLVYPTAITHKWGRLDDPDGAQMILRGKLAVGSS
jgi:hypothetical protein